MNTINPNVRPYLWAILLLLGLLLVWLSQGCNELRHYNKVANDKFPRSEAKRQILAPIFKLEFPPDVRKDSSTEKIIIKGDTSGYAAFRAQLAQMAAKLAERPDCPQINIDSLYEAVRRQIKPDTVKIETKVVETKLDSAGIKVLQVQYGQMQYEYTKKDNEVKQRDDQLAQLKTNLKDAERWMWYFWVTIGIVCAYIGLRIFKKVP